MNKILIKNIIGIILSVIKSFFLSVTEVAWGLASMIGLNLLLNYLIKGGTPVIVNELFLRMELFIVENIMMFVAVFFILSLYQEIKKVIKNE